mgnify:CR=1 FL=1
MRKIPTLFKRNFETWLVYNEITEGCEWVINGEGMATKKFDGTACMVKDGILYKRYDCKKGKKIPINGIACQPFRDPITGHWPFWIPVTNKPEDQYCREAFTQAEGNGTYELCGPKINGNPDFVITPELIRHGIIKYPNCPRTFKEIKDWFKDKDIEGIVWHHPDSRMCKIKKRDFGMKRKE